MDKLTIVDSRQKMDFRGIVKNINGTFQEYECPKCFNLYHSRWGISNDIHVYCDKCGDDNERP